MLAQECSDKRTSGEKRTDSIHKGVDLLKAVVLEVAGLNRAIGKCLTALPVTHAILELPFVDLATRPF